MCPKVLAEGKKPYKYFFDYWNVFDFLVVVAGFIPFAGGGAVMVGFPMPLVDPYEHDANTWFWTQPKYSPTAVAITSSTCEPRT